MLINTINHKQITKIWWTFLYFSNMVWTYEKKTSHTADDKKKTEDQVLHENRSPVAAESKILIEDLFKEKNYCCLR